MNILFLSELLHPHGGGGELATYLYARLLRRAGFRIAIVTNRFAGEREISKSENLVIYRLPIFNDREGYKYSIYRRFDVLLSVFMRKKMKWADLIYIPRFWHQAIPLAKAYGKPVITHLHGYIPVCPLASLYNFQKNITCNRRGSFCQIKCIYTHEKSHMRKVNEIFLSTLLNFCLSQLMGKTVELSDALICVSNAQKRLILSRMPILHDKIHVIYNPLPNLHETKVEDKDFGFFGGSNPLKGFKVLFKALKKLRFKSQFKVHATNFSHQMLWRKILSVSPSLAVYPRLPTKIYQKLYKKIGTVIFPSIWPEPLPYVVYEALLRGRLVIASSLGGIPEQVSNCPGTLLFKPGNFEKLADLIE
ncbi:MAG: glycosyltransferase, partial [Candidatus Bathyarchaeia archaeon]